MSDDGAMMPQFGRRLLKDFLIDNDYINLNHGRDSHLLTYLTLLTHPSLTPPHLLLTHLSPFPLSRFPLLTLHHSPPNRVLWHISETRPGCSQALPGSRRGPPRSLPAVRLPCRPAQVARPNRRASPRAAIDLRLCSQCHHRRQHGPAQPHLRRGRCDY